MDLTDESLALAREAVACKHWDLLPGMLMDQRGLRVRYEDGALRELFAGDLPVFSDRATMGCLLALARRAWGCDDHRRLTIEPAGAGWCVVVRNGRHRPPSRAQPGWDLDRVAHPPYRNSPRVFLDEYPTEEAALVAALKAAP